MRRYFRPDGRHFCLNDEITRAVRFEYANLADMRMPRRSAPGQDIVFCKNVTIYFQPEMTRRLVGQLHDALAEGGFLLLGHSESLWQMDEGFALVEHEGAFCYRRTSPRVEAAGQRVLPSPGADPAPIPPPAAARDAHRRVRSVSGGLPRRRLDAGRGVARRLDPFESGVRAGAPVARGRVRASRPVRRSVRAGRAGPASERSRAACPSPDRDDRRAARPAGGGGPGASPRALPGRLPGSGAFLAGKSIPRSGRHRDELVSSTRTSCAAGISIRSRSRKCLRRT